MVFDHRRLQLTISAAWAAVRQRLRRQHEQLRQVRGRRVGRETSKRPSRRCARLLRLEKVDSAPPDMEFIELLKPEGVQDPISPSVAMRFSK
jgi:hypothetical protein